MRKLWLSMLALPVFVGAQETRATLPAGWADDPPALASLVDFASSESNLRTAVTRYVQDVEALRRRYPVDYSPVRIERLRKLAEGWKQRLAALDFAGLNFEGQIDYVALRNRIEHDLELLKLEQQRAAQLKSLLPFFDDLRLLQEQRFDRKRVDARTAAGTLDKLTKQANELTEALKKPRKPGSGASVAAARAQQEIQSLRDILKDWHTFYDGYDPNYSWWARRTYAEADAALQN